MLIELDRAQAMALVDGEALQVGVILVDMGMGEYMALWVAMIATTTVDLEAVTPTISHKNFLIPSPQNNAFISILG